MENPNTWTEAEKVINEALVKAATLRSQGVIGLSTARQIADALRQANLLVESTK